MDVVLKTLDGLGYACRAEKLKASDFGVPQRRTRYYIIGVRNGSDLGEPAQSLVDRMVERIQIMRHDCPRDPVRAFESSVCVEVTGNCLMRSAVVALL